MQWIFIHSILKWLSAQEDIIAFTHCESFRSYMLLLRCDYSRLPYISIMNCWPVPVCTCHKFGVHVRLEFSVMVSSVVSMNSAYRSTVYHKVTQKQISPQRYMKFFKPEIVGLRLKKELKFKWCSVVVMYVTSCMLLKSIINMYQKECKHSYGLITLS
jgi:hypothetical protein